ncbi:GPI mannosyltransferase, partial [Ochromonadaceae sp. CCMP2298]
MKSSAGDEVFWVAAFSAFLAVNLVAASINHIDDTDETYGYWEPLHYLLYGSGLQTWEYAPQFAIRTYAFISPFYALVATSEQIITVSKLTVFKLIRVGLGLLAAYAEASFASSLRSAFGLQMALTTAAFMLCSPGLFFCATSYLPSAVCCTLLMLSSSAWLRGRFEVAILFGCVAVLCTGWPFVGLVFLPMGLHMLHARYSAANSQWSGLVGVVALAAVGLIEVAVIELAVLKIDLHYYNRVTSPTLNILLYNAMGSGDELYGVEPASYYIKNLFLNTGLAWPLFIAAPAVLSLRWALGGPRDNGATSVGAIFVLYLQAFIWLVVLFSRPHK